MTDQRLAEQRARFRARLRPFGIWSFALQTHPARVEREAIASYEALGYGAAWFPESLASKEALAHAAILLGGGSRIVIATGIANIHARDPMAMMNGARALAEAHPGRFLLGIGVSHASAVAERGGEYGRPIERMTAYLDAMDGVPYAGPEPETPVPVVLAALGPRMLRLAASRTLGAHPYFVPVEHTAFARRHLGPDPLLLVEQAAVLDADEHRSRATARAFAARYLASANYANNLRRMGWTDDDIAAGGSDRLLDAVIVRGTADAIAQRVRAHLDAGADHVCVQLRAADPGDLCLDGYRELGAALGIDGP
jgi:probable F420-dependent oxidoreductase